MREIVEQTSCRLDAGDRVICEKCNFSGTRDEIRKQTAVHAMDMAIGALK